MALHQIGYKNAEGSLQAGSAWNDVLGTPSVPGSAKPGDVVELIPGTHTGQKFTINVESSPDVPILIRHHPDATEPAIIDGEYRYPTGKAQRTGPDGDMVFGAMIDIRSPNVQLGGGLLPNGKPGIIQMRSRGRGIQFGAKGDQPLAGGSLDGVQSLSNRNVNIMARHVVGFQMRHCDASKASDYYQSYHNPEESNFPGCVVLHACTNPIIEQNRIHETWSDGLMLTMGTKGATVRHNEIYDIGGNVACYAHGLEDSEIYQNLLYYTGDPAWGHGGAKYNGASGIVCNNEEEFAGLAVRNLRIINNILLNYGLGIWANEGSAKEIVNVLYAHNSVICHGAAEPIRVLRQTGPRDVAFVGNLFYHPEHAYGDVVDWSGITMPRNGWIGPAPAGWKTLEDMPNVPLKNPDAELSAQAVDLSNYEPLEPCGFGVATAGIDKDFWGRTRQFWTVGALEYQPPPPPPITRARLIADDLTAEQGELLQEIFGKLRIEWS